MILRIKFLFYLFICSSHPNPPSYKDCMLCVVCHILKVFKSKCKISSPRSIHRLTQLERLDLGSNEFSELVRLMVVCKLVWALLGACFKSLIKIILFFLL